MCHLRCLTVFPKTRRFRRLRRPGSSRHRASPWAAPVPPTERAGSKGSVLCCLSAASPLWWLAPPLFPASGGTMGAGQCSTCLCGEALRGLFCHPEGGSPAQPDRGERPTAANHRTAIPADESLSVMSNSAGFMTRTFVFIGQNIISVISCLRQRPLWWLAPPPCPLGSVSLDSQSPIGSLRIQFPCHPLFRGHYGCWAVAVI